MTTDVAVIEDVPIRRFNPNDHIMQIPNKGGKSDYLPVQWRLVWFRELCPQGTIETQEIVVDLMTEFEGEAYVWNQDKKRSEKVLKRAPGYARFRAIVHDGKGGFATATKTEKGVDFPDFVEKAETGAVGRALAMLGYGTQFAEMELSEEERIVDAPVERKPAKSYQERKPFVEGSVSVKEEPNMATVQQLASIRKLLQHLEKPEPEDQDKMTYLDAKTTIVALANEYKESREQKPVQVTNSLNAPTALELQRLFKGINQSIETAQKLTFKGAIKPLDNLTPEECMALKKTYDGWKKTYDERQKSA